MKMPQEIETAFFAPCGMNCMICYKHCAHKRPCAGCFGSDDGKPGHCRKCKIKDCVEHKGISYCYECSQYPCKRIRDLEKSYRTRYGISLVENSRFVKQYGISAFLERQRKAYCCPSCGGVISLHDGWCSQCHAKF